jgi:hypothetical protein
MADKLMADVKEIVAKANEEELTPLQLANGAKELLDEVATGKITGEEDRYSHTDLWDFAANVEGSKAAIAALRPVLQDRDPALVSELDKQFAAVEAALAKHRVGDGWKLHPQLSAAELKELSDAINALGEPVSQVAPRSPTSSPPFEKGTAMGFSRRQMLTIGAAGAAGLTAAGIAGAALRGVGDDPVTESTAIDFYGEHQAGIVTPAQDRLHFVAFDVLTKDRAALDRLLRAWTLAAARMTAGLDAGETGAVGGPPEAPPDDTGEALGLPPSHLTLTVGFGPGLFDNRFGLADRRPAALADLPHFAGDALQPAISGGDICVQACADDPQVAVHAVRNLARIGFGVVTVRWSQLGSAAPRPPPPRNRPRAT